jgi:hypothetical protein
LVAVQFSGGHFVFRVHGVSGLIGLDSLVSLIGAALKSDWRCGCPKPLTGSQVTAAGRGGIWRSTRVVAQGPSSGYRRVSSLPFACEHDSVIGQRGGLSAKNYL